MRIRIRKIGVTRVRSGFLFFPRFIYDEWRWLEYATWQEEWSYVGWEGIAWIEEGKP